MLELTPTRLMNRILFLRQPQEATFRTRRISAHNSFTFLWSLHLFRKLLHIFVVIALVRKKKSVVRGALASITPASALWSPKKWPKASRKGSGKPAVESNGAVPRVSQKLWSASDIGSKHVGEGERQPTHRRRGPLPPTIEQKRLRT